ncbi:MAG: AMP-binding protein [Alphaproteobacteria bacterium]|nr:AMP-binding protein [Alphaproteobacteria bacterium]
MIEPGTQTVFDAFAKTAHRFPDRPMLNVLPSTANVYGISSGEMTYADALARVDELTGMLTDAGYGTGMRVGLLLENRPEFFLLWLALNRIGASAVPINPDLRLAELTFLIGHCEPALIIAMAPRQDELRKAAIAAGITVPVASPGAVPSGRRPDAVTAEPLEGAAREAAVLYTSGTTGAPKGCVLPNRYFLLAGEWYAGVGGLADLRDDGERMITPLPIFHMNAMAYSFMAMLAVGGCLTVLDRFHPRSWWKDVGDAQATCLHYLGVMPSMLIGLPASPADKAHSVRFGFGAGVDPKIQVAFETRFGFPLVEAWAMTETGAGAVIAASTSDRLVGQASIGRVGAEVETMIADDDGNAVDAGDPGELLVRRAGKDPRFGFFSHYYKDAEATAEAWAGGWFHSGDIVREDSDGNMFFVDRKKNVIRRSGENIAAVEVESILMHHPDIEAAGVAAVPDAMRGDEVFACLKVRRALGANDIVEWCLQQMAYYKVPGYVAFVDVLPLTATQKIQRSELKALALELLTDPATANTVHLKKRQLAGVRTR